MTIWFTSDEHYSHENIIRYCNRPFANADEMNEALIEEHNRVVKDKDTVYHLGDFTFRKLNFAFETISRLNGQHFFIRGNHDYWNQETGKNRVSETDLLQAAKIYFGCDKIVGIKDYLEIKTNDGHFILSHFPMFTWHKNHKGSMMLHGHCVDLETEILTRSGWKKRKELQIGEHCYSMNLSTREIEDDIINDIIDIKNYSGDVINFSGKSTSLRMTDQHTVIYENYNNKKIQKDTAKQFANKSTSSIFLSGIKPTDGIDLTIPEIKLYILMVSDGSVIIERNYCRIRVSKDRKKNYIRQILSQCGIEYNEYHKQKYTSFNFNYPQSIAQYNIKGLDQKLINCNKPQFEAIVEAYSFGDGNKNGNGVIVYSAKEKEIDLLQHIAVLNGHSATKHTRHHGFKNSIQYQLSIYPRTKCFTRPKETCKVQQVQDEHFWCIKNNNRNFLCRHNGKVMITGNCHGSIDHINHSMNVKRLDVGVDSANKYLGVYRPFSMKDVIQILSERGINPPDNFEGVSPNKTKD